MAAHNGHMLTKTFHLLRISLDPEARVGKNVLVVQCSDFVGRKFPEQRCVCPQMTKSRAQLNTPKLRWTLLHDLTETLHLFGLYSHISALS